MNETRKFKVGDLVRSTMGWIGIVLECDTPTEAGQYWWRVYNGAKKQHRIIGEWELEVISASR